MAFKANLYAQLTRVNPDKAKEYKQLQRDTLEKRTSVPWATAKTKADVFYTLGVSYWKESYDSNAGYIAKKQPVPPKVFDDMKPLVQKAHEYLEKTIAVDPNYANAWFYEKLVYLEQLKYDTAHQKDLMAKVDEMQKKYLDMQKLQPPAPQADAPAAK